MTIVCLRQAAVVVHSFETHSSVAYAQTCTYNCKRALPLIALPLIYQGAMTMHMDRVRVRIRVLLTVSEILRGSAGTSAPAAGGGGDVEALAIANEAAGCGTNCCAPDLGLKMRISVGQFCGARGSGRPESSASGVIISSPSPVRTDLID